MRFKFWNVFSKNLQHVMICIALLLLIRRILFCLIVVVVVVVVVVVILMHFRLVWEGNVSVLG